MGVYDYTGRYASRTLEVERMLQNYNGGHLINHCS